MEKKLGYKISSFGTKVSALNCTTTTTTTRTGKLKKTVGITKKNKLTRRSSNWLIVYRSKLIHGSTTKKYIIDNNICESDATIKPAFVRHTISVQLTLLRWLA